MIAAGATLDLIFVRLHRYVMFYSYFALLCKPRSSGINTCPFKLFRNCIEVKIEQSGPPEAHLAHLPVQVYAQAHQALHSRQGCVPVNPGLQAQSLPSILLMHNILLSTATIRTQNTRQSLIVIGATRALAIATPVSDLC